LVRIENLFGRVFFRILILGDILFFKGLGGDLHFPGRKIPLIGLPVSFPAFLLFLIPVLSTVPVSFRFSIRQFYLGLAIGNLSDKQQSCYENQEHPFE
jgi:hypothetical protein